MLVKGDGPPGLQSLYYKIDVYKKDFTFDFSHNDQFLKCEASLYQLDVPEYVSAFSTQKSSSIRISLLCKYALLATN